MSSGPRGQPCARPPVVSCVQAVQYDVYRLYVKRMENIPVVAATEARNTLPALVDAAERGRWPVIDGRSPLVLLSENDGRDLLGDAWMRRRGSTSLTDARATWSDFLRSARETGCQRLTRRGAPFLLAEWGRLSRALAARYRFHTEVISEPSGAVSLWSPELKIFGQGDSYEDAVSDLIDESQVYIEEWFEELRHVLNHRDRAGWVQRLHLLGTDRVALRRTLLEEPVATVDR